MAYNRFQRRDTAKTAGVFILLETLVDQRSNRLQLDPVTDGRAGTVAFNEIQFSNSIIRIFIGSFQSEKLAGNTGCRNGGIAAVG